MIEGMHEFYGAILYRKEVEDTVGRNLTDEEWENFLNKVGTEIDMADSEVIDRNIEELRKSILN